MIGAKVRVYKNGYRKAEEVIFMGTLVREPYPVNGRTHQQVKCEKIVDLLDPFIEIGKIYEVDYMRVDYIGVEPPKNY